MKIKVSQLLLAAAVPAVIAVSCKKSFDNDENFNYSYAEKSVGFNYAANYPYIVNTEPAAGSVAFDFGKIFVSDQGGNQDNDITVTITPNPTAIATYNSTNGTTYEAIPVSAISHASSFTIKKGTREVDFPATVNMGALDLSKNYAVAYTIATVSGGNNVTINKAYETVLITIGLKNKYDGLYVSKGFGIHPSLGSWPWTSPCGAGWFVLVTSGPNSVDLKPGHPAATSSGVSYFSTVLPRFTVDPGTNAVTTSGAPGNAVVFDPFPTYPARYDAATKTIFVKVGWSGTRIYTDTFTWCGPRP